MPKIINEKPTNDPERLERLVSAGKTTEAMSWGEIHDGLVIVYALKQAREEMGLSLSDVEEISGMDRSQISRLENGRTNPTLATLARYAAAVRRRIGVGLDPQDPCQRCGKFSFKYSQKVGDDIAVFQCRECNLLSSVSQPRGRAAVEAASV